MTKPTVYLDTSVISAYWYEGANVAMLARRLHTREWWEFERRHFSLRGSDLCETELQAGRYPRQRECLKLVRRLYYAQITNRVREMADKLVREHAVPRNKKADAVHLATAALHRIDYLLTWNYAHMANVYVQSRLRQICGAAKLPVPLIVSPESIPQVRFGLSVHRRQ